jgi:hypothetical protein
MAVFKVKRFYGDDRPTLEKQIAIWLARQPPNIVVQRSDQEAMRRAPVPPRSVVVTVWSE